MADYTNYAVVSWTDATPITSVRLNQMSTNIEQVKTANEDKPKGILKIKTEQSPSGSQNAQENNNSKIIALELSGGVDNRVTLDATRYYKFTLSIPNIIFTPTGEDGTLVIRLKEGNTVGSGNTLTTWTLQPPAAVYLNGTPGAPSSASSNLALRSSSYIGAGTYAHVISGETKTNQAYMIEVQRVDGNQQVNLPEWSISGTVQFYIEDVGGVG